MKVFVKNDKVVHIEGDPDSPVSRGRLCPKGSGRELFVNGARRVTTVPLPLRARLAVGGGALLELAVERRIVQAMGLTAEPLNAGAAGTLMRTATVLTLAGAAGRHCRADVTASSPRRRGAALMAGSACLRFGIFEAGQASARDPRYTIVPQRERRDRAARSAARQ